MNIRDVQALVVQRGWLTLSGIGTLFLVPHSLSAPEQGLFFTFLSLAAIQSIFEAGITTIFFNFTAHEKALLSATPPLPYNLRIKSQARLSALVRIARQWFITLALLFGLLVGSFGLYFINISVHNEGLNFHWEIPYLLLIASISLSLINLSRIPILEGHGKIADIAKFRLRSSLISILLLWIGMAAGWGLWALSFCYILQNVTMAIQISLAYKKISLPKFVPLTKSNVNMNWRSEIFPVQYRLAGSYFCGYFVAQAVVPFTLHAYGAVKAGQVGLMLSVFNALATIVASYMYAATPKYAEYIAHRQFGLLTQLFSRVTKVTLGAGLVIYVSVLIATYMSKYFELSITQSIASSQVVFCMVVIGLVNAFGGSIATLLRAQRKEPMLPMSAAVAFSYVIAMVFLQGATIEQLFMWFVIIQLFVATPMALLALKKSGLLKFQCTSRNDT